MVIVTIDGPAGSGKSTVARKVAEALGVPYLDTGAMYRAVTLYFMEHAVPPEDHAAVARSMEELDIVVSVEGVFLNGKDVTGDIRSPEVTRNVSLYASLPLVRKKLVALQRDQAREPGLVTEGRDMGSVVFPGASHKFFLVATPEERARRRYLELQQTREVSFTLEKLLQDILKRDALDTNRSESPLCKAPDAVEIDTTSLSIAHVVAQIVAHVTS